MAWTLTEDLGEFAAAAGDFLRSQPVLHTIQLTVIATLRARGDSAFGEIAPLFGWWRPGAGAGAGAVHSALLHTPPYPVLLTWLPSDSARPLAETLAARGSRLPGVNAEESAAVMFAAAWRDLTGVSSQLSRRTRLYRLGELAPPVPQPPGAARTASAADRDLLESWFAAFAAETGEGRMPGAVEERLSYGGLTLWEVDGQAVSMAGVSRTAAGVARVSPVYTPPDQRRRGYGAAATVAVSQAALTAGAQEVVLFTDLANPTSNALYQRLGYRAVEDRVVLGFAAEA